MEILTCYAMYDTKAKRYDTPFFAFDDVQAQRRFIMAINNPETVISQFKSSFELQKIGTFNVITGEITFEKDIILNGNDVQPMEEK